VCELSDSGPLISWPRDIYTRNMNNDILIIKELTKAYDEFYMDKAKRLGRGGFGKVYLIKSRGDESEWAAKYQKQKSEKLRRLVQDEARKLRYLQHKDGKHVMVMYGYYEKNDHTLLVTEYLRGGEIFAKIADRSYTLTEQKVIVYVKQMVRALNFMHSRQIVHLDIKPQNIMLKNRESDTIKLIDFGLAKKMKDGRTKVGFAGTIGFMAPEVLNCTTATPATDFFSVGVVMFMLLSGGHEPFWQKDEMTTMKRTLKVEPSYEAIRRGVSRDAVDFIDQLLRKGQESRLSGEACMEHPWLVSGKQLSVVIENHKMRSYMARQRWNKAIKAVRAMVRMQALLGDRTDSGAYSSPYYYSSNFPTHF